jgi:hypothetical protein
VFDSEDARVSDQNGSKNEIEVRKEFLYISTPTFSWYNDIKYYLNHGTSLESLQPKKIRALSLKSVKYQLIDGALFRKNYDNVFLICLEKTNADKLLAQLHDGPTRGHFGGEMTAHKILSVGYYWPTLFRDAYSYARRCKLCQTSSGREKKHIFPLQ